MPEIETYSGPSIAAREARLRRFLRKHEHRLEKTPARSWLRKEYGPGYWVIRDYCNTPVYGIWHRAYEATLDEVEDFAVQQFGYAFPVGA